MKPAVEYNNTLLKLWRDHIQQIYAKARKILYRKSVNPKTHKCECARIVSKKGVG